MPTWNRTPALLEGVRLLEFADESASFCGKLLADLGAEVVKVERPEGEETSPERQSLCSVYHNANKRRIGLDLENSPDREHFLRLAAEADVVLEGLRPGRLERLGLGCETLHSLNPRLILATVSGFGSSGPKRAWASCDLVASAAGGQLHLNGLPAHEPLKLPGFQALYLGCLHAAIGIVLALLARAASGRGDRVDVSLQEAVASGLDHALVRHLTDGTVAERTGSRHWNDSFFLVPCADGYLQIYPFEQWETLAEWMGTEGRAGDLADPRYLDPEYRRENFAHVAEVISRWTATHTRAELFETGQLMNFPWAPVCDLSEVLSSPQLAEREFFDSVPGGTPHPPYLFLAAETSRRSVPPSRPDAPSPPPSPGILAGLRVLDFTRVLAGPYATRVLADFGAEVIKVQSEKTEGSGATEQPYYKAWNRNKRSITLDLSRSEARDAVLDLVRQCDVVAENFAPRVFENWGFGYETLRRRNPAIIVLRMSAVGQTGPWRNAVAFGPTIHALSGLTGLTSYPGGPPLGPGFAHADVVAGLYGALSVAAAVYHRERTGRGQCIDLSEYEATIGTLGPALVARAAAASEKEIGDALREPLPAAPYGCFRCLGADRWCAIAVFDEAQWRALCDVLHLHEQSCRPEFAGVDARMNHSVELRTLIEERTSTRDASGLAKALQERGVPASAVQDAGDLVRDPHLLDRGFFVGPGHPAGGGLVGERGAVRLGPAPPPPPRPAPRLGEDNDHIFGKLLGWAPGKVSTLRERGVIG